MTGGSCLYTYSYVVIVERRMSNKYHMHWGYIHNCTRCNIYIWISHKASADSGVCGIHAVSRIIHYVLCLCHQASCVHHDVINVSIRILYLKPGAYTYRSVQKELLAPVNKLYIPIFSAASTCIQVVYIPIL